MRKRITGSRTTTKIRKAMDNSYFFIIKFEVCACYNVCYCNMEEAEYMLSYGRIDFVLLPIQVSLLIQKFVASDQ
jgi:hypothetical protein